MLKYDYVIVGAGICGCAVSYELQKHSKNILLIDKLKDVSEGASGAAGAFLSPLLGKPNYFKDLVTSALRYSTNFYKLNTPNEIDNCGTVRIPKNYEDSLKFETYIPFMDFPYEKDSKINGYFFQIGSVVNSYKACKILSSDVEKLLNYNVKAIKYHDGCWHINNEIITKSLILTTGSDVKLIDEDYIDIRPIWGQRIDVEVSKCINVNYHKECSISRTIQHTKNTYKCSIGATHHRLVENKKIDIIDTEELLKKANDIINLGSTKVIKTFGGSRSSSSDYLPIIGEVINSRKTLAEFPYLKNGTNVNSSRYTKYENLFILNGVGGRGFVLAPYLAHKLVNYIINSQDIDDRLKMDRLFNRWAKR